MKRDLDRPTHGVAGQHDLGRCLISRREEGLDLSPAGSTATIRKTLPSLPSRGTDGSVSKCYSYGLRIAFRFQWRPLRRSRRCYLMHSFNGRHASKQYSSPARQQRSATGVQIWVVGQHVPDSEQNFSSAPGQASQVFVSTLHPLPTSQQTPKQTRSVGQQLLPPRHDSPTLQHWLPQGGELNPQHKLTASMQLSDESQQALPQTLSGSQQSPLPSIV